MPVQQLPGPLGQLPVPQSWVSAMFPATTLLSVIGVRFQRVSLLRANLFTCFFIRSPCRHQNLLISLAYHNLWSITSERPSRGTESGAARQQRRTDQVALGGDEGPDQPLRRVVRPGEGGCEETGEEGRGDEGYRFRPYCSWLDTQSSEEMAAASEISPASTTPAMISASFWTLPLP